MICKASWAYSCDSPNRGGYNVDLRRDARTLFVSGNHVMSASKWTGSQSRKKERGGGHAPVGSVLAHRGAEEGGSDTHDANTCQRRADNKIHKNQRRKRRRKSKQARLTVPGQVARHRQHQPFYGGFRAPVRDLAHLSLCRANTARQDDDAPVVRDVGLGRVLRDDLGGDVGRDQVGPEEVDAVDFRKDVETEEV